MSEIDIVDLYELLGEDQGLSFQFENTGLVVHAEGGNKEIKIIISYSMLTTAKFNVVRYEVEKLIEQLRE